MDFEVELQLLKMKIKEAEDVYELNYLRRTNEKKYWWTNIFLTGLFYGLNGKIGKMILSWIMSPFTLGIYHLYLIYTAYKDQEEFNDSMELAIFKRKKELK